MAQKIQYYISAEGYLCRENVGGCRNLVADCTGVSDRIKKDMLRRLNTTPPKKAIKNAIQEAHDLIQHELWAHGDSDLLNDALAALKKAMPSLKPAIQA